jgi:uncharacterized protein with NRDE domain
MCTVTFVSKENGDFILTSNRDELPQRETIPPEIVFESNTNLLYPKDAIAGGTWIGVCDKKRAINLLNGAFEPHERKSSYRLSRGMVVKDLLVAKNVIETIQNYDFHGVEQFTIILVEWSEGLKLYSLVWDEKQKHFDSLTPGFYIWSSSPLYSASMKVLRKQWFNDFINSNSANDKKLLQFHQTAGDGDKITNLIMDRGFIRTVSITQLVKRQDVVSMFYKDLQTGVETVKELVVP